MTERIEIFAVDRVEGTVVVLVSDHGDVVELPGASLPEGVGQGTVLMSIPVDRLGTPQWHRARGVTAVEAARLAQRRTSKNGARKRARGGDVTH